MTVSPPRSSGLFDTTPGVDFGISDPIVPIVVWSGSSTNRFQVDGTLTLGGKPVAGAVLLANAYALPDATDANGRFSVRRDQSVLDRTLLSVKDLSAATVGGSAPTADEIDMLKAATFAIETAFTVALDQDPASVTPGAKNVKLTGTLTFKDGTPIPPIALWGYTLSGTIVDGSGAPLEGVYASVSDDEGETWAVSNETGADGAYKLRFYPIVGGSTYTVRIAYGDDVAKSDDEIEFKPETSSTLDLVLDTSMGMGMVMGTGSNGAFEVTEKPGAEYIGYLMGLSSGESVVEATLTWPEESGKFTIVISEVTATAPIGFFQLRSRFFSEIEAAPGADVPPGVVPTKLDAGTPRDIPPLLAAKA